MSSQLKYLIVALLSFSLYSCVKKKTYTSEPEIEFKAYVQKSPGLYLVTLGLKDGNGDVGKDVGDDSYNIFCKVYKRASDTSSWQWFKFPLFPDGVYRYIIRKTEVYDDTKPLLADVAFEFDLNSFAEQRFKFEVYVVDNAGNNSNEISTPELIVP